MGFRTDAVTGNLVPDTVLNEDIRNLTTNDVRVIAIYRKSVDADYYEEMTYKAKKVDWSTIKYPEELQHLLTKEKP